MDVTYLTDSASLISDSVLCLMKTGLPRHLMITFRPSGIDDRSTSTLAMASTSAEADMLTRKSVHGQWLVMVLFGNLSASLSHLISSLIVIRVQMSEFLNWTGLP